MSFSFFLSLALFSAFFLIPVLLTINVLVTLGYFPSCDLTDGPCATLPLLMRWWNVHSAITHIKPRFALLLKKDINHQWVCCSGDALHVNCLCHDVYDDIT